MVSETASAIAQRKRRRLTGNVVRIRGIERPHRQLLQCHPAHDLAFDELLCHHASLLLHPVLARFEGAGAPGVAIVADIQGPTALQQ